MNFDWLENVSNNTEGASTYVTPPTKSVRLKTKFVVSRVLVFWGGRVRAAYP